MSLLETVAVVVFFLCLTIALALAIYACIRAIILNRSREEEYQDGLRQHGVFYGPNSRRY